MLIFSSVILLMKGSGKHFTAAGQLVWCEKAVAVGLSQQSLNHLLSCQQGQKPPAGVCAWCYRFVLPPADPTHQ